MHKNVGSTERRFSLAAGLALAGAAVALARRPALAAPLALGSLALLARGASGSCPLYTALGVSTAASGEAPGERDEQPWDAVDEASRESFPASDPPSFTPGSALVH